MCISYDTIIITLPGISMSSETLRTTVSSSTCDTSITWRKCNHNYVKETYRYGNKDIGPIPIPFLGIGICLFSVIKVIGLFGMGMSPIYQTIVHV